VIVVVIASLSKSGGAYLGASLAGLARREGLALAVGLNARGAVEIVVATVGLSLGVLNASSYAVVVLLAMVTSMMSPPLLRAASTARATLSPMQSSANSTGRPSS